ncbi:MAG: DUF2892 domain-containing protein [Longimicrobiales bacterium]|nr:DUF2892 domain-containing protein [Longimicrobiales bacterium]
MTCNMGKGDRIIRGILGVVILGGGLVFQSWWGLVGLVFLITAIVAWCPAYVPFKINTGA